MDTSTGKTLESSTTNSFDSGCGTPRCNGHAAKDIRRDVVAGYYQARKDVD